MRIDKIILLVLATAMTVSVGVTTWSALTQQFNLTSLYTSLALFFASVIVAIYHKPPELQAEADEKILLLNKVIEKLKSRIDIREYEDIEIEVFSSPETIEERRARLGLSSKEHLKKIELLVRNNGGVSVLSSFVTMEELHWEHPEYKQPYDGVETKPFLWADSNSSDGKRNIPPTGKGHLIIATQHTDMTAHFRFNFYDGESNVFRTLPGRYVIKIRVDGQVKKENDIEDLSPVFFDLSFVFDGNFSDVTIKKLPKPAT